MIYFEGSSFELNSSAVINGKFTFYNVEPLVIIHCKTCMLFCNTAVGKEIPYAFLADPQSVSFLCITSVNKYEGFAVIFYKIIYTGIKLTISNKEPFAVIFYKLCNLCTDSSFCQEIPLITNRSQTRSLFAENAVYYEELFIAVFCDTSEIFYKVAIDVITVYSVLIFPQTIFSLIIDFQISITEEWNSCFGSNSLILLSSISCFYCDISGFNNAAVFIISFSCECYNSLGKYQIQSEKKSSSE